MKIELYDIVRSLINRDHITKGDEGTVVEIWSNGEFYEIEFLDRKGKTIALLTMKEGEFEKIDRQGKQAA